MGKRQVRRIRMLSIWIQIWFFAKFLRSASRSRSCFVRKNIWLGRVFWLNNFVPYVYSFQLEAIFELAIVRLLLSTHKPFFKIKNRIFNKKQIWIRIQLLPLHSGCRFSIYPSKRTSQFVKHNNFYPVQDKRYNRLHNKSNLNNEQQISVESHLTQYPVPSRYLLYVQYTL